MLKPIPPNYFLHRQSFKSKSVSIILFIIAAFVAWEINLFGQIVFPSHNLVPYLLRTTITLLSGLALIAVSGRLFKYNGLSIRALGLTYTKMPINFGIGVLIGIITIFILAALLNLFLPYHFITGTLSKIDLLKESYSYLLGNVLEELMFRGFLLIIFSQLTNWRIAVVIMALPFGLFHLQGTGMSMEGLKIVTSTTLFSFVFSFAYILTGSMWTSVGAHVVMNILLHAFWGLDGLNKSIYVPGFYGGGPKNYALVLGITLFGAFLMAILLYFAILIVYKRYKLKGKA